MVTSDCPLCVINKVLFYSFSYLWPVAEKCVYWVYILTDDGIFNHLNVIIDTSHVELSLALH